MNIIRKLIWLSLLIPALSWGQSIGPGATIGGEPSTHTLSIIKPASDSTTAIQIQNAAGTSLMTFDTTNSKVILGGQILAVDGSNAAPAYTFSGSTRNGIYKSSTSELTFMAGNADQFYLVTYGISMVSTRSIDWNNDVFLYRSAANTLAIRNSINQQAFIINNTYTDGSNYERMKLTGVQGASVNITAETAGSGGDNLAIILTPAGTSGVQNASANITVGAGTGITVVKPGNLNRQTYQVTVTYAAYSDTDTKKGVVIATLPAKTKLVGCYADTTASYTGGAVSATTLRVGVTAEDAAEIIADHDVFSGAVTKGLADADMGTSMTRAASIQGGYLPSWTGTTAIYATINTTTANTSALTAGSTTFYLVTERF